MSWKTLSTTTLFEDSPIEVLCDRIKLPSGEETEFKYLNVSDAVVVFPITEDGEIITTREWRQPVRRQVIGLPGGSLDADESPEEAAKRELEEETGYVSKKLTQLRKVEVDNGISNAHHYYFFAQDCRRTGEKNKGPYEAIEVELEHIEEFMAKIASGDILDSKTLIGMFLYMSNSENWEFIQGEK